MTGRKWRVVKFEIRNFSRFKFSENNFFKEKNCTIVNFPLTGLDLSDLLPTGTISGTAKYDLIGNVVHLGTA